MLIWLKFDFWMGAYKTRHFAFNPYHKNTIQLPPLRLPSLLDSVDLLAGEVEDCELEPTATLPPTTSLPKTSTPHLLSDVVGCQKSQQDR